MVYPKPHGGITEPIYVLVVRHQYRKERAENIYEKREKVSLELKQVTEEIEDLCNELGIENPLLKNIFDN